MDAGSRRADQAARFARPCHFSHHQTRGPVHRFAALIWILHFARSDRSLSPKSKVTPSQTVGATQRPLAYATAGLLVHTSLHSARAPAHASRPAPRCAFCAPPPGSPCINVFFARCCCLPSHLRPFPLLLSSSPPLPPPLCHSVDVCPLDVSIHTNNRDYGISTASVHPRAFLPLDHHDHHHRHFGHSPLLPRPSPHTVSSCKPRPLHRADAQGARTSYGTRLTSTLEMRPCLMSLTPPTRALVHTRIHTHTRPS